MTGESEAAAELADERRRAVLRHVGEMNWVWLVPLALLTLVLGYLMLVFVGMMAGALGGELNWKVFALSFGVPILVFVVVAAIGVWTSRLVGRRLSRSTVLAKASSRWVGLLAATSGALAAAGVTVAVLAAQEQLG